MVGSELTKRRCSEDLVLASYHRRKHLLPWHGCAQWHHLELKRPRAFVEWASSIAKDYKECILLHFACSMADSLNRAWSTDVEGTMWLCRHFAKARKDIKIAIASSVSADHPTTEYGYLKLALEEQVSTLVKEGVWVAVVRIPQIQKHHDEELFATKFLRSASLLGAYGRRVSSVRHIDDKSKYDVFTP